MHTRRAAAMCAASLMLCTAHAHVDPSQAGCAIGAKFGRSQACQQHAACLIADPAVMLFDDDTGRRTSSSKRKRDATRTARLPPAANATVLIVVLGGRTVCTGALVNNTRRDGRPLILTAAHCLKESDDHAAAYRVVFGYQHASCPRSQPDVAPDGSLLWPPRPEDPVAPSVVGIRVHAVDHALDVALVELVHAPPVGAGVYLAGWSRTADAPSRALCIHHPSGDVKMYASTGGDWVHMQRDAAGRRGIVVEGWWRGAVERGSSGSPLVGPDGRVAGVLLGGSATCATQNALRKSVLFAAKGQSVADLRAAIVDAKGAAVIPDVFRPVDEIFSKLTGARDLLDPLNENPQSVSGMYI